MSDTTTPAVVIDANGHFGNSTRVWFAGSVAEAKKYASRQMNVQVIADCHYKFNEKITLASLQTMLLAGIWKRV